MRFSHEGKSRSAFSGWCWGVGGTAGGQFSAGNGASILVAGEKWGRVLDRKKREKVLQFTHQHCSAPGQAQEGGTVLRKDEERALGHGGGAGGLKKRSGGKKKAVQGKKSQLR